MLGLYLVVDGEEWTDVLCPRVFSTAPFQPSQLMIPAGSSVFGTLESHGIVISQQF